jgi:hypothetical protein
MNLSNPIKPINPYFDPAFCHVQSAQAQGYSEPPVALLSVYCLIKSCVWVFLHCPASTCVLYGEMR